MQKRCSKRGLLKFFGPILGFYTKNSPRNSWSPHFRITIWYQKSRNAGTSCSMYVHWIGNIKCACSRCATAAEGMLSYEPLNTPNMDFGIKAHSLADLLCALILCFHFPRIISFLPAHSTCRKTSQSKKMKTRFL